MTGHLHLTAVADPRTGRTALAAQSFRAPMHVGKGHWDDERGGALTVHTVNATAGLFAGDAVDWRVRVEPGARLRLVGPSATRVFRHARPGGAADDARTDQAFRVAGGGARLEVWPEGFIPHAGSRHRQTTRLDVAAGGGALLCEVLAPGRVASGEAWAFGRLRWALDVTHAERLVVRERWDLAPTERPESLAGWRLEDGGLFDSPPFYAALYFIGTAAGGDNDDARWQALHDLHEPGRCWVGVSRLDGGAGWTAKILAADGVILRRVLGEVRRKAEGRRRKAEG